jgi:hypothetical protein
VEKMFSRSGVPSLRGNKALYANADLRTNAFDSQPTRGKQEAYASDVKPNLISALIICQDVVFAIDCSPLRFE